MFLKTIYHPPHLQPLGKLYIVFILTLKRRGVGKFARYGKLAVWAMFFPFKEHKPYQGTLGSLEVILIGSRIRPSPSMDPTGTLKWTS